jgi:hypothetical protein
MPDSVMAFPYALRHGRWELQFEHVAVKLFKRATDGPCCPGIIRVRVADQKIARRLETKKHPAPGAAETIKESGLEKKRLRIEKRLVDYRLALLESLFPWLAQIGFADVERVAELKLGEAQADETDPVAAWLSKDELSKLSERERNERALDRYKKRSKTDWEIGRDFERFIGYKLELDGCDVIYNGAIKGFDDFGRDLIVTDKAGNIRLIQCKYWAKHKVIPEAAIFQLLGTTIAYHIEKFGSAPSSLPKLYQSIQPYICSSAPVAPRVRDIALVMGIIVQDDLKMVDWPMVKCNLAAGGKKIYHLPMDQQYDRVKLGKPGERYVNTVAEAEQLGFRRAKRWVATA